MRIYAATLYRKAPQVWTLLAAQGWEELNAWWSQAPAATVAASAELSWPPRGQPLPGTQYSWDPTGPNTGWICLGQNNKNKGN